MVWRTVDESTEIEKTPPEGAILASIQEHCHAQGPVPSIDGGKDHTMVHLEGDSIELTA